MLDRFCDYDFVYSCIHNEIDIVQYYIDCDKKHRGKFKSTSDSDYEFKFVLMTGLIYAYNHHNTDVVDIIRKYLLTMMTEQDITQKICDTCINNGKVDNFDHLVDNGGDYEYFNIDHFNDFYFSHMLCEANYRKNIGMLKHLIQHIDKFDEVWKRFIFNNSVDIAFMVGNGIISLDVLSDQKIGNFDWTRIKLQSELYTLCMQNDAIGISNLIKTCQMNNMMHVFDNIPGNVFVHDNVEIFDLLINVAKPQPYPSNIFLDIRERIHGHPCKKIVAYICDHVELFKYIPPVQQWYLTNDVKAISECLLRYICHGKLWVDLDLPNIYLEHGYCHIQLYTIDWYRDKNHITQLYDTLISNYIPQLYTTVKIIDELRNDTTELNKHLINDLSLIVNDYIYAEYNINYL